MPDLDLKTPVQYAPGVGPFRAICFEKLGIRTVGDLIQHIPFRYDVQPRSVPIGQLQLDQTATVVGTIRSLRKRGGPRKPSLTADVVDGTGRCTVRWFNADYLANRLQPGQIIRMTGKVDEHRHLAQFINPQFDIIQDDTDPFANDVDRFQPVYPAIAALSSKTIAAIIGRILPTVINQVAEPLPDSFRTARNLPPRSTAIARAHQPIRADDYQLARRRLAYDEFLLLQLAVQFVRRDQRTRRRSDPILITPTIDDRIRKRFPFSLTAGQNAAVKEIATDLAATRPMNRMLQGDVGCGKTAVALYAALATIANRHQVVILAPTEILARQHDQKTRKYLEGSRVHIDCLVGADRTNHRSQVLAGAANGKLDLLIGTHALLEKDIAFKHLGLVIIDEQHKFGVAQRAAARHKGTSPHVLIMSATPIPRTLAMTVFGDLDITTIPDAPPGRKTVTTRLVRSDRIEQAWAFLRERLSQGQQAYIVYPLVDDSDSLPLKSVNSEVEHLRTGPLAGFNIAHVHGKTPSSEKADIMNGFKNGDVQALISTTVIEVGIDVPNATVMIVQHADRFGLAQLHQLRGRIGRGDRASHCLLVSDAFSGSAAHRLDVLTKSTDGFAIAEADLKLRGPGELLGTKQHGLPQFKAANPIEDLDLLTAARDDAAKILAQDPELSQEKHHTLRAMLRSGFGDRIPMMNVG